MRLGALSRPVRQGLIVGVTNPKAVVFFAAVLPQFVTPGGLAIPLQITILGLVFCLLATTVDIIRAYAAGTARQWFTGSPRRMRRVGGTGGVLIMGLGLSVLATSRNP